MKPSDAAEATQTSFSNMSGWFSAKGAGSWEWANMTTDDEYMSSVARATGLLF